MSDHANILREQIRQSEANLDGLVHLYLNMRHTGNPQTAPLFSELKETSAELAKKNEFFAHYMTKTQKQANPNFNATVTSSGGTDGVLSQQQQTRYPFPGNTPQPPVAGPSSGQQYHKTSGMPHAAQGRSQEMTPAMLHNLRLMQQVVLISHLSADELRAHGIEELTIQFIETNRAILQQTYQEQKAFLRKLRNNANGGQTPLRDRGGLHSPVSSSPFGAGVELPVSLDPRDQSLLHQYQQSMLREPKPQQGPTPTTMNDSSDHAFAKAEAFIWKEKSYYTNRIPKIVPLEVSREQMLYYTCLLESLLHQCNDTDSKLPTIYVVLSSDPQRESYVRRLIIVITIVRAQRTMLSDDNVSGPRFLFGMDQLMKMSLEHARIVNVFETQFNAMDARQSIELFRQIALHLRQQQMHQPHMPPSSLVSHQPRHAGGSQQQLLQRQQLRVHHEQQQQFHQQYQHMPSLGLRPPKVKVEDDMAVFPPPPVPPMQVSMSTRSAPTATTTLPSAASKFHIKREPI